MVNLRLILKGSSKYCTLTTEFILGGIIQSGILADMDLMGSWVIGDQWWCWWWDRQNTKSSFGILSVGIFSAHHDDDVVVVVVVVIVVDDDEKDL